MESVSSEQQELAQDSGLVEKKMVEKTVEESEDSLVSPSNVPNEEIVGLSSSQPSGDTDEDTPGPLRIVSGSTSNSVNEKKKQGNRPGVILLGRGNSFSLGRSEVIVVHNRKQLRTRLSNKGSTGSDSETTRTNNSNRAEWSNGHVEVDSCQEGPTPPPISNGESETTVISPLDNGETDAGSGDHVVLSAFEEDDLDILWRKAESVMFAKQREVQKVLEDFGIGESGGGGEEEEERVAEEENVWQVVQENFQV